MVYPHKTSLTICTLALLVVAGACDSYDGEAPELMSDAEIEAVDSAESLELENDESDVMELQDGHARIISTLTLSPDSDSVDATVVRIYALEEDDGAYSVGVLEAVPEGGIQLSDIAGLGDQANPREVFQALAGEDAEEPSALAANYPEATLGARGWAVAEALSQRQGSLTASNTPFAAGCGWTAFANAFNAFYPEVNGTKYWYSSVSPEHSTTTKWNYQRYANTWRTMHVSNARGSGWSPYVGYNHTFYNVDKYKTKVKVCNIDNAGTWIQRSVVFRYRNGSNTSYVAASVPIDASDEGTTFSWRWTPSGNNNYDWATLVTWETVYPNNPPSGDQYHVAVQKKG